MLKVHYTWEINIPLNCGNESISWIPGGREVVVGDEGLSPFLHKWSKGVKQRFLYFTDLNTKKCWRFCCTLGEIQRQNSTKQVSNYSVTIPHIGVSISHPTVTEHSSLPCPLALRFLCVLPWLHPYTSWQRSGTSQQTCRMRVALSVPRPFVVENRPSSTL